MYVKWVTSNHYCYFFFGNISSYLNYISHGIMKWLYILNYKISWFFKIFITNFLKVFLYSTAYCSSFSLPLYIVWSKHKISFHELFWRPSLYKWTSFLNLKFVQFHPGLLLQYLSTRVFRGLSVTYLFPFFTIHWPSLIEINLWSMYQSVILLDL